MDVNSRRRFYTGSTNTVQGNTRYGLRLTNTSCALEVSNVTFGSNGSGPADDIVADAFGSYAN